MKYPQEFARLFVPGRRSLFKAAASLLAPAGDRDDARWVGTWTARPQHPEPPIVLPAPAQFDNQTIRQVVRTSVGGRKVRVRLTCGSAPAAFDAVIDFDRAIRDPSHPTRMLPAYDSGDHLHPNDAGYKAMADFIDLRLFRDSED
jgi:hypothetical protein